MRILVVLTGLLSMTGMVASLPRNPKRENGYRYSPGPRGDLRSSQQPPTIRPQLQALLKYSARLGFAEAAAPVISVGYLLDSVNRAVTNLQTGPRPTDTRKKSPAS